MNNWRKILGNLDGPGGGFIPTNKGYMTPEDIVGDLTYRSYAYNRDRSPDITPEQWKTVFGPKVDIMERRYQQELSDREVE